MGRNFSPTTDKITLGDIAGASFLSGSTWSILAFFRVVDTATDDRAIVSKWDTGGKAQFLVRTDKQVAPANMEVYVENGQLRGVGGDNVQLNTWYLVAVTCDGLQNADSGTLYLVGMDGTFLDDAVTFSIASDSASQTAPIRFGMNATSSDPMDGDMADVTYVEAEVTKQDVAAYLHIPHRMAAKWKGQYGVQFSLPLGIASPDTDFSGSGNTGTLTGTTIGDNPPVAPWYGFDVPSSVAAAVAGGDPEGGLVGGKLIDGGILSGRLVG